MTAPRGLTSEEVEAWEKVAATVEPMHQVAKVSSPVAVAGAKEKQHTSPPVAKIPRRVRKASRQVTQQDRAKPAPPGNLDSHWDKRLKSGAIQPDFTLDLHGHGLDAAYNRLMSGVAQARAMGARTILLVTGKPRPVDPADRGTKRGAIRAKVLDWLAASSHHSAIAAVRRAHIRHGGEGALYIVLRRERG